VATVAIRVDLQVAIVALALMIPLALTSTKGWMRRLGRNWKLLHRLVYVAAALSIAHFYLLGTNRASGPLRYAFILAALLVLRLPSVRRAVWNFLH